MSRNAVRALAIALMLVPAMGHAADRVVEVVNKTGQTLVEF